MNSFYYEFFYSGLHEMNFKNISYNILLIGDSDVGKTLIFKRFLHDHTNDPLPFNHLTKPTVYADLEHVDVDIINDLDGSKLASCRIGIWDTAGIERFNSFSDTYFHKADGIIIVYDIANRKTFESCQGWMERARNNVTKDDVQFILAGNKTDMGIRAVPCEDGKFFADDHGMDFFEVSAIDGFNISSLFQRMAAKLFVSHISIGKQKSVINNNQYKPVPQSDTVSRTSETFELTAHENVSLNGTVYHRLPQSSELKVNEKSQRPKKINLHNQHVEESKCKC